MGLTYAELTETPIGPLSLAAGDQGLQAINFSTLKSFKAGQEMVEGEPSLKGLEVVGELMVELTQYFSGIRETFSVELDWFGMTPFQKEVLALTVAIPFGEIRTYGQLATQLGSPNAARAVGAALAANPMPIVIPCHRVVGADRGLHGFAAPDGIRTKAYLLELEGVSVENGRVVGRAQERLF